MEDKSELMAILNEELRRIQVESGQGPFLTVQAKAKRLGVDKSYYSKLANGHIPLTGKKAYQIAKTLRTNPIDASQLEQRLVAAGQDAPGSFMEITGWFKERAKERCLMIVEFRDFGVVRSGRMNSYEAKICADSIVDGLSYALIRPFSDIVHYAQDLPQPVYRFLSLLQERLFSTYLTILETVLLRAQQRTASGLSLNQRRDAILTAEKRLKLYKLSKPSAPSCPGVGYRLFYTERPGQADADTDLSTAQLWDWFTAGGRHHLVRQSSDSKIEEEATIHATAIRFYPIREYWLGNSMLPQKTTDLDKYAQKLQETSLYETRHGLKGNCWEVVEPPSSLIEKYLPMSQEGKRKR